MKAAQSVGSELLSRLMKRNPLTSQLVMFAFVLAMPTDDLNCHPVSLMRMDIFVGLFVSWLVYSVVGWFVCW